ncbi:hypothetical protein ANDROMEDA_66 [Bacillus phage Andromeda]|uniref:DUF1508 domain-containing protein n=2 Tax=Andromedavirus andromeda TaxID=1273739 RepID=M1IF71_9CAUD|nr:hypothetical protein I905_gp66 [Bacillus phage Andromeda]AGE60905.1 hypothetical protein GEMINI_66 [Bacillus phage Gemini]AGE61136.1 hypothetical protein ANDROMEDA_66 [Bacillus phage Andromeda]
MLNDVGYGTMKINEFNEAIFYNYNGRYTWYVKHKNGSVSKPSDKTYGTIEEAKEVAKKIYNG